MVTIARECRFQVTHSGGRLKTEFATRDGAKTGARELKKRFPMLRVRIYDDSRGPRVRLGGRSQRRHVLISCS